MEGSIKKSAINRLKRIAGQINGLERMVAADKYCIHIIHQSLAVKKALSSFEDFVLENHLSTHVIDQIKSGRAPKATKEILKVYRLSKRK